MYTFLQYVRLFVNIMDIPPSRLKLEFSGGIFRLTKKYAFVKIKKEEEF